MNPFRSAVFTVFLVSSTAFSETNTIQTFIVSVESAMKPFNCSDIDQWYSSILTDLNPNSSVKIQYIYKTVFEGFSAKLTPQQAQELVKRPEIHQVFPEHIYRLQTTRSPVFLGLRTSAPNGLYNESEYGNNVIIGLLDSGIWPELRSFNDEGLGPIPSKWKGECQGGEGFPKTLCNKKLIGVRYFSSADHSQSESNTARDTVGHGTHTASTAAGRAVNNASFLGTFARGTAVGIAPKARLAIYKVCSAGGCSGADVLAGFDKAVEDGVDVISISLGPIFAVPFTNDEIAIGSFGAMENRVIVSASAGNSGPSYGSACNVAPWMITVGASTIDRKFPADLLLENGGIINGISLFNGYTFLENEYWPLIYAGNASLNDSAESIYCAPGSLDEERVRGKIVVCDSGELSGPDKGLAVNGSGGVGVIVASTYHGGLLSDAYLTPGISISESARRLLFDYMSSSPNPRAMMVFRGTQVEIKPAPVVAFFSSRGPNPDSTYVMKPDVVAPGVEILAAWSKVVPPSRLTEDTRHPEFNILSGTSMSCPHVSGIAALLKGVHKDWSPSMIKSAIMTTAYTHDQDGNPLLEDMFYGLSNAWIMGSGHVDPEKARDPGLVYDMTPEEYVEFLCASNLTEKEIKLITRRSVKCKNIGNPWDINYPAISVAFEASKPNIKEITVKRTLTKVDDDDDMTSYNVKVSNPNGTSVSVDPPKLVFKSKGEKQSYIVRVVIQEQKVPSSEPVSEFGQIIWTDGKHQVTSPLIVTWS